MMKILPVQRKEIHNVTKLSHGLDEKYEFRTYKKNIGRGLWGQVKRLDMGLVGNIKKISKKMNRKTKEIYHV